jgi:adenosine deaminase
MRFHNFKLSAWRLLPLLLAALLGACATAPPTSGGIDAHFETLKATPARLTPFLRAMPKGADLHSHLSGAIYAESYIEWATADGLCLVLASRAFAEPPCDAQAGRPPVAQALADTAAYNAQVDALSMRNYEKGAASGHNQFFATFARFGAATSRRAPEMLVEAMSRAADQNILYLELMTSPGMSAARALGQQVGWSDDPDRFLEGLRQRGLDGIARQAAADNAASLAGARQLMACGSSAPRPGCAVTVRFLAQVVRTAPREQVFAQVALGLALAAKGPDFVGINLVAPEDDRISLGDYSAHMRMVGALRRHFPAAGISLHAGELAPGLVPPKELRFHIAEAVRVAGATRIGHGVDILHEDGAETLLAEMARRNVMVEINLTSNDVILGVSGHQHPFMTYRAFSVPMALSTDDEGVSRIDLTREYERAVMSYGLNYADIKALSRNGLSHAFIAGDSLWQDSRRFLPVAACGSDMPGAPSPSAPCAAFLRGSAKATLQWALERDYRRFEAALIR